MGKNIKNQVVDVNVNSEVEVVDVNGEVNNEMVNDMSEVVNSEVIVDDVIDNNEEVVIDDVKSEVVELDISKIKELMNNTKVVRVNGEVVRGNGVTKAVVARGIMKEMYLEGQVKGYVPARKDIINRLVKDAGLTDKGAATYLQNWKKEMGLVNSKS